MQWSASQHYVVSVTDFSYRKTSPLWRSHHRLGVTTDRGLYFLDPKSHSKQRCIPGDSLVAPPASSSSTGSARPTTSLPKGATPERAERSATMDAVLCKDDRPQMHVRGSMRSGR